MRYAQIVYLIAVSAGLLYAAGFFSERLRESIGEHVPMEPAPAGLFVLFCIGATLGLYSACLAAPASYLATGEGRKLMRMTTGTQTPLGFRVAALMAVVFLAFATASTLYHVFVYQGD